VTFGNLPGLMPGGADTYQSYDLPWANASNTPFRLYKHWVHEGGIATPMVACWPGVTPKGSINHSAVHITDFMATFLEVADASYPDEYDSRTILPTEGVSFLAALRGAPWEREAPLFWEHEGNRAVRLGAWKLVSQHPDAWELYNLDEDRTELNNLADRDPVRARALAKLYEAWSARCDVLPWDELLARRSRDHVDRSRA
jgi:arylsulfatase